MSNNENIFPDIPETNEAPKPGTKAFLEAELAKAMAEIEALKNAGAAKEDAADTHDAATTAEPVEEERVEIFVPRGYAKDEPNLMIAVNGVTYLLPRGKKSYVPKHIADEFYRSQAAQDILDSHMEEMLKRTSN